MTFTTSRLRAQFEQIRQLRLAGQTAMAQVLAGQVVAAMAVGADDFYCQGSLLLEGGRAADALKRFDQAVRSGPATPELLVDRAIALLELGRLEDAAADCEAALKIARGFAPAYLILGDIMHASGKADAALAFYDQAAGRKRDFLPALQNRFALALEMGRFEEALADLDRLLRAFPDDVELLASKGQILGEMFRFDDALRILQKGLALQPRNVRILHNFGVVYWKQARYQEALDSYDAALAQNPNLVLTLSNRANTLQELNRLDEAMAAHDLALKLAPNNASARWNRSQLMLMQGHWAEGLAEFEWHRRRPATPHNPLTAPLWDGTADLNSKTLVLRAEQGLGDTLQYCRYAALAQDRGAKAILHVQPPLARLLREALIRPADAVVAQGDETPTHDLQIGMMSLPLAFGSTVDTVPAPVPYLKADPARAARWADSIGKHGFRIGIAWQGAQPGRDMGRSYPVALLAGIAVLPGVRLIALQKGDGLTQLATLPPGMVVETLGEDFDNGPDAFLDSAAAMASLDLVITSDTSIAHLAGALARPVWLASKLVPEWRWLLGRADSVWYPTMRLFRQTALGDWNSVFAAMEKELAGKL